jgi:hypothetical protein
MVKLSRSIFNFGALGAFTTGVFVAATFFTVTGLETAGLETTALAATGFLLAVAVVLGLAAALAVTTGFGVFFDIF